MTNPTFSALIAATENAAREARRNRAALALVCRGYYGDDETPETTQASAEPEPGDHDMGSLIACTVRDAYDANLSYPTRHEFRLGEAEPLCSLTWDPATKTVTLAMLSDFGGIAKGTETTVTANDAASDEDRSE